MVADSSFYIQPAVGPADADLHKVVDVRGPEAIRLLFPIAVVDELDGLKDSGKHRARYRASHTLGLMDAVLNGSAFGILRQADFGAQTDQWRGEVSVEIVLDQPGHVRLSITDDEIIDRAVAIQALAARDVRLLTCDTGQHTRGRSAGLEVTKVPAKDPGQSLTGTSRTSSEAVSNVQSAGQGADYCSCGRIGHSAKASR
ncbi:hypothetical protein I2W78_39515 [Streptomyces spinoverrucosus]|uniref:PIN domain-containing protein n=1 Tax=Streptomyces spinoverrucosus TaxID=284043 RepID=UPI0018C3E2E9|nr:hypothetical protein [Streptomyces spinoverrucosus]